MSLLMAHGDPCRYRSRLAMMMNRRLFSTAARRRTGWCTVCCVATLITWGRWRLRDKCWLYLTSGWRKSRLGSHWGIHRLGKCWGRAHRRCSSHAAVREVIWCTCLGAWTCSGSYWGGSGWYKYIRTTDIWTWRGTTNWILASGGITVSRLWTRIARRWRSRMWVASQRTNYLIW